MHGKDSSRGQVPARGERTFNSASRAQPMHSSTPPNRPAIYICMRANLMPTARLRPCGHTSSTGGGSMRANDSRERTIRSVHAPSGDKNAGTGGTPFTLTRGACLLAIARDPCSEGRSRHVPDEHDGAYSRSDTERSDGPGERRYPAVHVGPGSPRPHKRPGWAASQEVCLGRRPGSGWT